jgi:hypothetical protein
MDSFAQALCFFCVVMGGPPYPQVSQRAAGDIWYTHEMPGRGDHLLRLSTTDYILDSDRYRVERLDAFAYRFADQTCHGRFTLGDAGRASWPTVRPVYARQYVFRCR